MWEGLAVTLGSCTSLPGVDSDSWVPLVYVGHGRILIHCGVSLARSARYPIRPQSDLSLLDDINSNSFLAPGTSKNCPKHPISVYHVAYTG